MKKLSVILVILFYFIAGVAKVTAQTEKKVCSDAAAWQQAIQIDPSLVQRRQQMEEQIEKYLQSHTYSRSDSDHDELRIIPTVFHIIQEGGKENIPDSWVQSCISITNADYRRLNADTVNTPAAFRPVAADTKIEFRLATKDPYGNCTNGIDRVFSHRTENFSSFAQSLIDWPSDRYLNIWVVKTISNGGFTVGGQIIGYGQFPVSGPSSTDGVVLRSDFIGNLPGTDVTYAGRDADHEIGHYLNMIHIWGDADCGDDKCNDTPTQFGPNESTCPTYPSITCSNNGDMSDNYMDYSLGSCKDIWTQDQKARMRAALDVARFTLWQQSNLIATGTDSASYANPSPCAPVADFLVNFQTNVNTYTNHINICPGSKAYFEDNSTNGVVTSWLWSFPGGTPSSSTLQNPVITYSTKGTYHVTLTVTNAQGSNTKDVGGTVIVERGYGNYAAPYTQGFDGSTFPPSEWRVFNDDGGPAWQQTNRASYSGGFSASIQNHETITNTAPGSIKILLSPAFNFSLVSNPTLTFRLSYGVQFTGNKDSLSIGASTNCGSTWIELKRFGSGSTATSLSANSGGFQPNDFAPTNSSQWQLISVPLASYAGMKNVMFRFYFKTDLLSNNLYIDDININGTVGFNEAQALNFSFDVAPNPSNELFKVSYELKHAEDLRIDLFDIQGRLVKQVESLHAAPGSYQTIIDARSFNLEAGVYLLRMATSDGVLSKKIIYTND